MDFGRDRCQAAISIFFVSLKIFPLSPVSDAA
jgi:hypothetical protein